MQTVVGPLKFCSRFVFFLRSLLNSSYLVLTSACHLQCCSDKLIIMAQIDRNVAMLAAGIQL